jgi:hypothetical protein
MFYVLYDEYNVNFLLQLGSNITSVNLSSLADDLDTYANGLGDLTAQVSYSVSYNVNLITQRGATQITLKSKKILFISLGKEKKQQ